MIKGLQQLVEARIQAALSQGPLAGKETEGRPLAPDPASSLPEAQRFEAILARSCGGVPEEVVLLKEVETLRERYDATRDEGEREALRRLLSETARRASVLLESGGRYLAAKRVLEYVP